MQPPIFYINPDHIEGELATLDKKESHHAHQVMRLKKGAVVILIDGNGNAFQSELVKYSQKQFTARILSQSRNFGETNAVVTLASGLSTGYKFDYLIEKGTELGIKRFVPLLTEKGKVKLDDPKRIKAKLNRYHQVALAAAKQCRRSYIPQITAPIPIKDFLKQIDPQDLNLIFHPVEKSPLLKDAIKHDKNRITLIVGPESGFSHEEISLAEEAGITPISLGKRILRTETAGPAVTAMLMHELNEFR